MARGGARIHGGSEREAVAPGMVQDTGHQEPLSSNAPAANLAGERTGASSCCGCGRPIADRYLLRLMDSSWHEACLQCCICHLHLSHSCYSRDHKLYCKHDYDRLFGVRCAGCDGRVLAHELVLRAGERVFHVPCFVCVACGKQLEKGEQFVVRTGQLYCRPDFEKELLHANGPASPTSDVGADENHRPPSSRGDGRRGPKRPRTILTSGQRRAFKAAFEVSPKPCRKVRETLAKETGLSVRVVQVWFQNQRAKIKKIERRTRPEGGSPPEVKEVKEGRKRNRQAAPAHQDGEGEVGSASALDSQPLAQALSPEDMLDHDPDHLEPKFLPFHVNPIDKLYLMQNSYFTGHEQ